MVTATSALKAHGFLADRVDGQSRVRVEDQLVHLTDQLKAMVTSGQVDIAHVVHLIDSGRAHATFSPRALAQPSRPSVLEIATAYAKAISDLPVDQLLAPREEDGTAAVARFLVALRGYDYETVMELYERLYAIEQSFPWLGLSLDVHYSTTEMKARHDTGRFVNIPVNA